MELKGENAKKLNKEQKEKAINTLKRMEEIREIDAKDLRQVLLKKLVWAEEEKVKNIKQLEETKVKIYKLEGIILLIKDITLPKLKEKK